MKDVLLAKVAVSAANFSIDKPYTYQIPETFAQQVTVGMRVLVPFGRGNRHTEGLVLALEQQNLLPLLRIRRANFFNPPGWRIEAHLRHFAQLFEQHIAFAQKPAQDCIDKAGKTLRALISANGVY